MTQKTMTSQIRKIKKREITKNWYIMRTNRSIGLKPSTDTRFMFKNCRNNSITDLKTVIVVVFIIRKLENLKF